MALELTWRSLGYQPSILDTKDHWCAMRDRVYAEDTVALIGASRMLYDVSIPTMRESLPGREIVQDAHVETPEIDADFALVVTGGTRVDCSADVDGDGVVGILDFLLVLAEWNQPGGPADVNSDGIVGLLDFLIVLAEWGLCP